MIKKSLILFVLVLVMFSFIVSAVGENDEKEIEKYGYTLPDIKEGLDAAKADRPFWEKAKDMALTPFTWTRDNVVYPVLGIREGAAFWMHFFMSLGIGLMAGLFAFSFLNIFIDSNILDNSFLIKIFEEKNVFENFINFKILYMALSTGVIYAALMSVPVINTFFELITLQTFTRLLGETAGTTVRGLILAIIIVLIFFLPSIIRLVIQSKNKSKDEKILRKAALKEAMQDLRLKQMMKDFK